MTGDTSTVVLIAADVGNWSDKWRVGGKSGAKIRLGKSDRLEQTSAIF
ncbi:hypothetical protein [Nostoc sp. UIC 10630]|nr:hypothetical protein [Nostoc sp. UIC 10630]NEU84328.1 hypothetical protein [Nostoc sp. UIC 10630]